jgi:hypothetical protein
LKNDAGSPEILCSARPEQQARRVIWSLSFIWFVSFNQTNQSPFAGGACFGKLERPLVLAEDMTSGDLLLV